MEKILRPPSLAPMGKWTTGIPDHGGSVREDEAQSNGETRSLLPAVHVVFFLCFRVPYRCELVVGGFRWLPHPGQAALT